MKKLLLTLTATIIYLAGYAQTIDEESSDKYHYFFFVNPMYWEFSAAEPLRIAVDVRALVNPVKNIWGDFLFQKAYVEGTVKGNYNDSGVQNKYSSFQNIELGARFAFSNRVRTKGLKVITGGSYIGNTSYTESVNTSIPKRKIYAIGGGFYANHQMASTKWGQLKQNDDAYVHTKQGADIGGFDPLYASLQQQGIYGRFSIITITSTEYSFKISGQNRKRTFESRSLKDLSFDVMLPLNTSLDDFIVKNNANITQVGTVELGKDDTFTMRNMGFKVNFTHLTFYKKIGLSTGIDAGVRPGIKQGGFFFGAKVGASFTR